MLSTDWNWDFEEEIASRAIDYNLRKLNELKEVVVYYRKVTTAKSGE